MVFFLIFIFEGLGIREGRTISRFILYLAPVILYGIDYWNKKQIVLPFKLTVLFILFLIGISLSTLHAANIQSAFDHQLYYISLILLSFYVINHRSEIEYNIPYFIVVCSVSVLTYALFINFFLPEMWSELLPVTGFQFVYGSKELFSHYPIGAFLLIPLTYLYITVRQKPTWIVTLLALGLFIVMIFSFLRASYVAFLSVIVIDTVFILQKKKRISFIHKAIILGTILTVLFFFLSITAFKMRIPFFSEINNRLRSDISLLSHKSADSSRVEFISQSVRAIKNDPVFGMGSYNFYYASQAQASSYDEITGTSHNIFIDIWVENGFVAFVAFTCVIIIFFLNTTIYLRKYNQSDYRLFSILVAMLILFQLGHYHKMYFMILLFFTIFMLLYKEKDHLVDSHFLLFKGSIVVAVIGLLLALSYMLSSNGNYLRALTFYPIAIEPNLRLLYQYRDASDISQADIQAEKISYLYPKEPDILEILGDYYRSTTRHDTALSYYYSALSLSPHDLSFIKNTYLEMEATAGKEQADLYLQKHFSKYQIRYRNPPYEGHEWFYDWCQENDIPCD